MRSPPTPRPYPAPSGRVPLTRVEKRAFRDRPRVMSGFNVAPPRLARLLVPRGASRLLGGALAFGRTSAFDAAAQRIHQVDDLGGRALGRPLDLLSVLLLVQQVLERFLVAVVEFLRLEVRLLGLDDLGGELQHVLRSTLFAYTAEIRS